jgi:hypothetical protein
MSKSRNLSKQQLAVLEDLFTGELDEQGMLDKHGVRPDRFERWLADETFIERLEQRMARAHRQSRLILARYAPLAAAKLVELTHSDKEETARKACLDIIALQSSTGQRMPPDARSASEPAELLPALPPETASRLLAALAEGVSGKIV